VFVERFDPFSSLQNASGRELEHAVAQASLTEAVRQEGLLDATANQLARSQCAEDVGKQPDRQGLKALGLTRIAYNIRFSCNFVLLRIVLFIVPTHSSILVRQLILMIFS
jgi:hypothetical protein